MQVWGLISLNDVKYYLTQVHSSESFITSSNFQRKFYNLEVIKFEIVRNMVRVRYTVTHLIHVNIFFLLASLKIYEAVDTNTLIETHFVDIL